MAHQPGRFGGFGDHVPRWLADAAPGSSAGRKLLSRAVELYDGFEISRNSLVHGDLHRHNILDAGDRYVAIDPNLMLGEPASTSRRSSGTR